MAQPWRCGLKEFSLNGGVVHPSSNCEEDETEGDFWDMPCTKIRGIRMACSSLH